VDLLRHVREVTLGAHAHQDLPFERLVEELAPERALSHAPLFQVLFVLQNAPQEQLELPGLSLTALPVETGAAKFDLVLRVGETQDGLVAILDFNTDLFKSTTASRILEYFQNLLRSIEASPESPLNTLEMFSEVETIAFQEQITIPELAQGFAF
jgi:non-ribosomal peptide synthetase component F